MFFQVLFTVLCFVKDLRLWSFFDTYSRSIFALTWRSLCGHLGHKVDNTNMFTALASKLDFKAFLNDSDTTWSVNAAKTVAQSCQRWKTVFRLRLCGQIKGGAVQKTNRKRRNSTYEPTRMFFVGKQRNVIRNLLVCNDSYEDFDGKTGRRKTTHLRHLWTKQETHS